MSGASPRKVLVIRFGSLGDVVLATAALDALAAETPAPEVHLVTKAAFAPLFDGDPRVTRVFPYDGNLLALAAAVRAERYACVLDLHATPRSRLVALAGSIYAAQRRLSHSYSGTDRRRQ